jgi:hypothetical protein
MREQQQSDEEGVNGNQADLELGARDALAKMKFGEGHEQSIHTFTGMHKQGPVYEGSQPAQAGGSTHCRSTPLRHATQRRELLVIRALHKDAFITDHGMLKVP